METKISVFKKELCMKTPISSVLYSGLPWCLDAIPYVAVDFPVCLQQLQLLHVRVAQILALRGPLTVAKVDNFFCDLGLFLRLWEPEKFSARKRAPL